MTVKLSETYAGFLFKIDSIRAAFLDSILPPTHFMSYFKNL